jgi:hypothetical protein
VTPAGLGPKRGHLWKMNVLETIERHSPKIIVLSDFKEIAFKLAIH